jgi:hypothetical protein
MILSVRTLQIIKNFAGINQSLIFPAGNFLSTSAVSESLAAYATIAEANENEFAIFDLFKFLNVMSVFDTPTLTYNGGKFLVIEEADYTGGSENHLSQQVNYVVANKFDLNVKSRGTPKKDLTYDANFLVTKTMLDTMSKAQNIIDAKNVVFEGDGTKAWVTSQTKDNAATDVHTLVIGAAEGKPFKFYLNRDNFKLLPDNYKVGVSATNHVRFQSADVTYWISGKSEIAA